MDGSKDEENAEIQFALHKAVFDNDLRKLNQIIKQNKNAIDKKVTKKLKKFDILSKNVLATLITLAFHVFFLSHRINMAIQRCTWPQCWGKKVGN